MALLTKELLDQLLLGVFLETKISSCLPPGADKSFTLLVNKKVESSAVIEGKYSGSSEFMELPKFIGSKSTGFLIASIAN